MLKCIVFYTIVGFLVRSVVFLFNRPRTQPNLYYCSIAISEIEIEMSTQIVGDVILFGGEREAIYDQQGGVFKFYQKYKSCLPTNINLSTVRGTDAESRTMLAEIWIPVCSPSSLYSDRTLVSLRGRLIMLSPTNEDLEDDEDPSLIVFVEVAHCYYRRMVPSVFWTLNLLQYYNFPEVFLIGTVAESIMGANNSIMYLIRTNDKVNGGIEEFIIA